MARNSQPQKPQPQSQSRPQSRHRMQDAGRRARYRRGGDGALTGAAPVASGCGPQAA